MEGFVIPERYGINIEMLTDLGLTLNQARVYLSTAKAGPSTISEIAEHSGVRREEIYRLLPDLEKIGLVERLMGKPMRIRTPNVKSAMSSLIRSERVKAQERISQLVDKSVQIQEYLAQTGLDLSSESAEKDDFALLEEKESIRTRLHVMIGESEKQIDVFYQRPNLIWFLSTQGELLKDAVARGRKIRMLSNPTSGKDRIPKILNRRFPGEVSIELKYTTDLFANFVIVDSNASLIITSSSHQPNAHNLFTRNPNLVSLVQREFEEAWNQSAQWKTVEGISISERSTNYSEKHHSAQSILLVYQDEKRKQKVLSNFIKDGLENNSFILYLCSDEQIDEVKDFLISNGVDAISLKNKDVFRIVDIKNFSFNDNDFSLEKAIDTWDGIYMHASEMSLSTITIIDMQFFFDHDLIDHIIPFENEINRMLDAHMSAMCFYKKEAILGLPDPLDFYGKIVIKHNKIFSEKDE